MAMVLLLALIAAASQLQQQKKDPTAATALKETVGEQRWRELDASWRKWVLALRFE